MNIPKNLKYLKSHEWVRVEGNRAYIGITDHAQHELGDIVFVDLPKTGKILKVGDEALTIESVKAASPIYSPLSGTIVEANTELEGAPEKVNEDAYAAWIFVLEMTDSKELTSLLDAQAYQAGLE